MTIVVDKKVFEKTPMNPTQYVLFYSDGSSKQVRKSTFEDTEVNTCNTPKLVERQASRLNSSFDIG